MVFTVSEVLERINNLIDYDDLFGGLIRVQGEISNFKVYGKHAYFYVKDEKGIVKAVFFSVPKSISEADNEGKAVEITAKISVYAAKGDLQLYVKSIDYISGTGILYKKYEELKEKLHKAGIIPKTPEERKEIPFFPKKVGVICSINSAAFSDIVKTFSIRNPFIQIYAFNTGVQGINASNEITRALKLAQDSDCDVLILSRGGGSFEDLWPFNEEAVVKAVRESTKPIIAGIGHEIDHPLSEYAADFAASTPTAAAMKASEDIRIIYRKYRERILLLQNNLTKLNELLCERLENRFSILKKNNPQSLIENQMVRLEKSIQEINNQIILKLEKFNFIFSEIKSGIKNIEPFHRTELMLSYLFRLNSEIESANPFNLLKKGYSLVLKEGKVLTKIEDFSMGKEIDILVQNGTVTSEVKKISTNMILMEVQK